MTVTVEGQLVGTGSVLSFHLVGSGVELVRLLANAFTDSFTDPESIFSSQLGSFVLGTLADCR